MMMTAERKTSARAGAMPKGIQSIEVGYRVLLAIQRGPGSLQLVDIAKRAGLTPGSTHNYLVSLVRTGLVEQEARGLYRLGPSAFALSMASFRQLDGIDHLREEADILHRITGQSVAVSVWSQAGPVSVYILKSEEIKLFEFRPGLVPMLRTGVGAIYMGYLEIGRTEEIVQRELEADGHPSENAAALIRQARQQVRAHGYGFFGDEGFGHAALALPVWNTQGHIAFVLDIVGKRVEIDPQITPKYLDMLRESVERASMRLRDSRASSSVPIDQGFHLTREGSS